VTDSDKLESVDIVIVNTNAVEESNKPCLKHILQFLNENQDWSPSATFNITSKVQAGSQKWVVYHKNKQRF
jgi:predicted RNA methylase